MKTKEIIIIMILLLSINFISAEVETLGNFKQNTCIRLVQGGAGLDNCNITSITRDKESVIKLEEVVMQKQGSLFNYTFCNSTDIGTYIINGFCNNATEQVDWAYDLEVTPNGEGSLDTGEAIIYAIFIIFLGVSLVFLLYFIFVIPSGNDVGENGEFLGILKLKYIKAVLVAISYGATLLTLNLMVGLFSNFGQLDMFTNLAGFIFKVMFSVSWLFTLILIIWVLYNLVKDTNLKKQMGKLERIRV